MRVCAVLARVLAAMGGQPTTCVHALAKDRNQALSFGRFLDHSSVSHGEMLTTAGGFTGQRAAGRHVLAIQELAESVDLFVVDVAEVNPPAGVEALHWRLLTTHAIATVEEAKQIIGWYRLRWTVEHVFRMLKSAAMQTEDSQVTQARRFVKLAVVGLIAAVRIMQIVIGRDGTTARAMADATDPVHEPALTALNRKLEGRTAKRKNPHTNGSSAWFAWIVARLGGWSGYTSRGCKPAGPKTIARGLARLDGFIEGWALHSANA